MGTEAQVRVSFWSGGGWDRSPVAAAGGRLVVRERLPRGSLDDWLCPSSVLSLGLLLAPGFVYRITSRKNFWLGGSLAVER